MIFLCFSAVDCNAAARASKAHALAPAAPGAVGSGVILHITSAASWGLCVRTASSVSPASFVEAGPAFSVEAEESPNDMQPRILRPGSCACRSNLRHMCCLRGSPPLSSSSLSSLHAWTRTFRSRGNSDVQEAEHLLPSYGQELEKGCGSLVCAHHSIRLHSFRWDSFATNAAAPRQAGNSSVVLCRPGLTSRFQEGNRNCHILDMRNQQTRRKKRPAPCGAGEVGHPGGRVPRAVRQRLIRAPRSRHEAADHVGRRPPAAEPV